MNEKVKHSRWGEGIVIAERYNGLELLVRFDKGFRLWMKQNELKFLTRPPQKVMAVPISVPPKPPEEEQIARIMIESLRLGVVPTKYIHRFTFGREREVKQLQEWLKTEGGVLHIIGQYGSGKTHLLKILYSMCLELGYAVAFVGLDPTETPFHRPKKVYSKIIETFRFRDGDNLKGFREFLKSLGQNETLSRSLDDHIYLGQVIRRVSRYSSSFDGDPEIVELYFNWLEGKTYSCFFSPGLYDDGKAANIYCNILSGISTAAKRCGLKGLTVIFDETENVQAPWLYTYQKDRAANFLKGMTLLAKNDQRLVKEPVERARDHYPANQFSTLWLRLSPLHYSSSYHYSLVGTQTGLTYHSWASHVRYAYCQPSHMKIVFAFTPTPHSMGEKEETAIYLSPLTEESKLKITEELARLYSKAYSFSIKRELVTEIFEKAKSVSLLRLFIKGVIEILDFVRYYPHKSMDDL